MESNVADLLTRACVEEPGKTALSEAVTGRSVTWAGLDDLVQRVVQGLADAGMAVVFISSEMSEVVRVAHRIVVLRDRVKVGELPGGCSEDEVYEMIAAEHA